MTVPLAPRRDPQSLRHDGRDRFPALLTPGYNRMGLLGDSNSLV